MVSRGPPCNVHKIHFWCPSYKSPIGFLPSITAENINREGPLIVIVNAVLIQIYGACCHILFVILGTEHAAASVRGGKHTYLHHNKEVKDQDKRSKECSGNFITGQKSPIQLVPADPVRCNHKYNHRRQSKKNCPVKNKTLIKEHKT